MYSSVEVVIPKHEKNEIVEHLKQIKSILDKYPSSNNHKVYYITVMSRAQSAVDEAYKWCGMIHTE